MIKLKDVSKIYYNNGAVGTGFSNISIEFNIGEFVVVVGESGSGKSTLLNVISGLDTYEEGEMYINGEETSHYAEQDFEDYRRKYVANIFQSFNLVNSYTVKQNVELVLLINGYNHKDIKKRVEGILKDVGLWELRNKKVTKLSGGQKQRVAIARALAKETPIIIADEPTGNLDSESANQVFELLHKAAQGKLVIVVTHNPEQVEKYATRMIRMHDGHIVEDKKIKKVEKQEAKVAKHEEMSFISKYLLSLRNTFNIIPRFLIVLGIFLVATVTILGEFADVNNSEYKDAILGASDVFIDNSPERIIVNKDDKSFLSDQEIEKIKSLDYVDRVVVNDWTIDQLIYFSNDDTVTELSLIDVIDNFDLDIVEGKKDINDGEVILVGNKDSIDFLFKEFWFNKSGNLEHDLSYLHTSLAEFIVPIKIVGYAYDDDLSTDYNKFYVTNNTYKILQAMFTILPSKVEVEGISDPTILVSNTVPKGKIFINNNTFINEESNNKKVTINTFYEDINLDLAPYKRDFENGRYYDTVYLNPNDIMDNLSTNKYQLSVYADDYKKVEEVVKELKNLGYDTYPVKDTNILPSAIVKLYDFINYIGIGFIIIALFFVSYFVITLVLKSKTTYYAVVRILGGNIKLNKQLIKLELFNSMTLAFIITILLSVLSYNKVINIVQLTNAIRFLKPIHFIIIYVVMFIFSLLLSHKYSKKIFKDSMITTYNREI